VLLGIDLSDYDDQPADYVVWPEHHQSVEVFVACATQWRAGSMGVIGLDYGVIFQVMALYDVTDRRATFADLQIMEAKAMEILNKRAQQGASR
jgi:uncharacterized membrane protein